jgi:hypothetical protein
MLAIVIPYYKLTFFEETLQSLSNQTDKRFKVYIGDDSSPESPDDLLDKYQGKFDFVYKRFNENLGGTSLTQQWDRCIALSGDEEWLMILGDDDVLGENVVEEFYENFEEIKKEDISVVRFATYKIDELGQFISGIYENPQLENSIDFLFRKTRSSLSEYVFRKKEVLKIGFSDFPLGWLSDVLAVFEFSNFNNIYSINESIVYIRISNLSISGNEDNTKLKSKANFEYYYYLLLIKEQHFTEIQKKELLLRLSKCYSNNKKEGVFFFKLSKIYLINLLIKDYFVFILPAFLNGLKNLLKARRFES